MSGKRLGSNEPEHRPTRGAGGGRPAVIQKTPKKKPSNKDWFLKIAILVVAVLLVLAVTVVAGWKMLVKPPDVTEGLPLGEEVIDPDQLGDIEAPVRFGSDRKKDFYTFLVIGRDTGGGGNTDTVLLAAYDVKTQKMSVMSIPRDTMVNVSWDVKKINSVYNVYRGGEAGIAALGKELAQLVGFTPDFQVVLEWKAVGELVDALGGVYYNVPRDMYYNDPGQDLHINIKKGAQTLNGEQAMQVVRFRDGANGYKNGDLGRIETQQGFLKAVVEQCLKIGNVTKIGELSKVFKNNVTTNMELSDLAYFGEKALLGGLKPESVHFVTMPCTGGGVWSRSYGQKLSYVLPNTDELVALINESFNPYVDPLQKNELDIMYVNSDGTIGSSSGKLEDTKANASVGSKKTNNKTESKTDKKTDNKTDSKTETNTKPNTGTSTKPNTGSNTKPNTGNTTKPDTGTTKPDEGDPTKPDPDSGTTTKPDDGGTSTPIEPDGGTTEPSTPPTEPTTPTTPESGSGSTEPPPTTPDSGSATDAPAA